ncbi:FimV/HubP family polar landmark protein [Xenophilus sp. Marseille-Q4582]|uniref:FimV/HubP family polar landmark protein n=1 Tax=Xenophilus sp. Marseille-Q4582 TaxID=2866600 RepID=UPI001CE3F04F|nr:FimV/HubP family polar landmark protein [Xenophilus sp. Marseille-Q4582]
MRRPLARPRFRACSDCGGRHDRACSGSCAGPRAAPAPGTAPPPPQPSLLDQLLENPLIPAGGAIALLLLGFLAYRLRGRKKADVVDSVFPESKLPKDSFFGATGGESVDTNSSRNSSVASSLSYSPSQLDAGDVDPVAEADVYLAYGRDLQAEEILREALRTTPERTAIHLKLLEIHAKRRDLRAFEMLANDVRKLTGGSGADWSRVIDMGRELDPGNPLYQGSAAVLDTEKTVPLAAAGAAAATATTAAALAAPPPPAEPPQPFVPSVAPLDFDLDLSKPAPLSAAPAPAPTSPPAPAPAFSAPAMEPPAAVPPPAYEAPRATPPAASYAPTARSPLLDHDPLDNDFETAPGELHALSRLDSLDAPRDTDRTHPATLHAGLPGDSGFIEFDMTAMSGLREGGDTRPNPLEATRDAALDGPAGGESPHAIKLSLARELHALGDAEGARSLLEEVVSESSGELRTQAQQLLGELR